MVGHDLPGAELSYPNAMNWTYGQTLFMESPFIADYIRQRTTPSDRITVVGSEPQIYFYAHRRMAGGCLYSYPMMERQPLALKMQQQFIEQVEDAKRKYIVCPENDIVGDTFDTVDPVLIYRWLHDYVEPNYTLKATVLKIVDGHALFFHAGSTHSMPKEKPAMVLTILERRAVH